MSCISTELIVPENVVALLETPVDVTTPPVIFCYDGSQRVSKIKCPFWLISLMTAQACKLRRKLTYKGCVKLGQGKSVFRCADFTLVSKAFAMVE